jgi:S1-C subfamily serine protease
VTAALLPSRTLSNDRVSDVGLSEVTDAAHAALSRRPHRGLCHQTESPERDHDQRDARQPPRRPAAPAGRARRHDPRQLVDRPVVGAPPWPPATGAPRPSRAVRRTLLAGLAIACLGAGGGSAWALTSSSLTHPTSGTIASGAKPSGAASPNTGTAPPASIGGSSATSAVARIDAAVVDITATLAGSTGEVAGTGMIITSSGEVLTNNHVIEGTASITVQVDGSGPLYSATVIGDDPTADVALLQIHGVSGLATAPLGDFARVSVGDQITAIGNALGRGGTPAEVAGIVSGLDQVVTASDESGNTETLTGMIQVEAAIQPGDSGGPEINAAGLVIGMTTAGSQSGRFGQSSAAIAGFAIPIHTAMQIVAEIRAGGGTNIHLGNGALLGVDVSPGATNGAAIVGVVANTPAAVAGIVAGDTITSISGQTIRSSADLHSAMQRLSAGQQVLIVWVDAVGTSDTARVTLASGPSA